MKSVPVSIDRLKSMLSICGKGKECDECPYYCPNSSGSECFEQLSEDLEVVLNFLSEWEIIDD